MHPFYDGNGRTDRFITSYFLSKHFHPLASLRLSIFIKKKIVQLITLFSKKLTVNETEAI
ncbi:MAG: Fic family protein [Phascolarctobacterium succinatutens]|uniref:Fic family protein n=1 Tax=Phascolarctobacterium succinatutens TaxID=626940 RepID=UPI003994065F